MLGNAAVVALTSDRKESPLQHDVADIACCIGLFECLTLNLLRSDAACGLGNTTNQRPNLQNCMLHDLLMYPNKERVSET